MEFADVGDHCYYDLCQQQTYLPFKCEDCNHQFCRFHRTQESHECPKLKSSNSNSNSKTEPSQKMAIIKEESKQEESKEETKFDGTKATKHNSNNKSHKKPFKCKRKGCKKREWTAIQCDNCHQNYCIRHRSPDEHNCNEMKQMTQKNIGYYGSSMEIAMKRQSLINQVLGSFRSNDNNNNNGNNGNNVGKLAKNRTIVVK